MKNNLTVCLLFLLFSCTLSAQQSTDTDKVKVYRAMMDYIEGFYQGDSAKIIRCVSPSVVKYGYWKDKGATVYTGEAMSYDEMISYSVAEGKKTKKARIGTLEKAEIYEIQDQTACGKVTAWWGTDYILLEKVKDNWTIRMILWQGPLKK